ncbi:replication initiation protein [Xenorhabdus bovienii]|uniref:Replication initiation protein n=2 Tax=Xenorhabdus bovienii TaxID=40576 RepID=A0AAJ1J6T2_XENBV|nr:replication initiation protein [Xenorhabdus bovienii]MDE1475708.1 replication initiation protein [Xenorhabdus bovienii]MDE1478190.1 replication initiation protein [Xenorhabdus bovienii]MDE1488181.1 replication initiation protein [Xenorhabdus bovienii]MDE1495452.1 replication initiation protein [Xenorhabdus bovienii]MDE9433798.1 replication initiation protein [Xenorhabdus bovienii]
MCELIAYKSNALIEASYKLTLQEQRVLLMCIGKLNPQNEAPHKAFQLTANEFYLAFPNMGTGNAERHLQDAIDRLSERWIQIHWKHKKEDIRWIQQKAKYFDKEGKIEITFSDSIMPYLTQLKGQFTSIAVKNISELKRTYSIRIYELLMQFKKSGDRLINVEDFRSMLGLEDKYLKFSELNKFVIKPAIKELNEKSNLTVNVDMIKKGRTIVSLHFQFKENKQIKIIL